MTAIAKLQIFVFEYKYYWKLKFQTDEKHIIFKNNLINFANSKKIKHCECFFKKIAYFIIV